MPNSRKEFEHNMHLLSERFNRDQVQINISNVRTIKGIKNARLTPNKRANLHTIDEMARVTANTIARIDQEQQFNSKKHEE